MKRAGFDPAIAGSLRPKRTQGIFRGFVSVGLGFLSLGWAGSVAVGNESEENDEAKALFEQADAVATKGNYLKSRKLFRQVESNWPGSDWAKRAALRTGDNALLRFLTKREGGPHLNRVDVIFMGDGFLIDPRKQRSFDRMVDQSVSLFQKQKTFREYLGYFNFHQMNLGSKDDGVDMAGREYDTALDAKASGGSQGQVIVDRNLVFKYLKEAEQSDGLAVVMVLKGTLGTGGGGVATFGGGPGSTFIHEWGHAFAPLGDEYSSNTGHRGGVGHSANVSGNDDPDRVPWAHWLEAKVPGIGIFEGANGQTKGAWKPTVTGCVMGSGGSDFCVVCREAIVLRIYKFVDPIDGVTPAPPEEPILLAGDEEMVFAVQPMTPAGHRLETTWVLEDVGRHSSADLRRYSRARKGGRRKRNQGGYTRRGQDLDPLRGDVLADKVKKLKKGKIESSVTLRASELQKGDYRLTVEVRDPTDWVLLDEDNLLVSRRSWLLTVKPPAGS